MLLLLERIATTEARLLKELSKYILWVSATKEELKAAIAWMTMLSKWIWIIVFCSFLRVS